MPEGHLDEETLARLRRRARELALWTPHLPPEWGGLGVGSLGMALISQELGVSAIAPLVLNCAAPDEGNMHLLEKAATHEQRERYLRPLAAADLRSCFAMTEQASGADAAGLKTRAVREGDTWTLTGEKWFITGAAGAAFAVVVAVTDPNVPPQQGMSLFLVDADTPGWEVVREVPVMGTHAPGGHCEIRLRDVRVPHSQMLGVEGQGFALAQVRLGPARLAHCMRWIGMAQRALDIATQRALTRETFGAPLAERQAVQWMLADSALDLYASRLMVLHSAWLIEHGRDYRQEVSMAKVYVAEALDRIVDRAIQVCGALGYSGDLPLERFYRDARAARIYDGPSEVHRMVIARNVLKAQARYGGTKSATGGLA
jgi:alkylation response protein AidB-like acyl-CoA dehydrogenase